MQQASIPAAATPGSGLLGQRPWGVAQFVKPAAPRRLSAPASGHAAAPHLAGPNHLSPAPRPQATTRSTTACLSWRRGTATAAWRPTASCSRRSLRARRTATPVRAPPCCAPKACCLAARRRSYKESPSASLAWLAWAGQGPGPGQALHVHPCPPTRPALLHPASLPTCDLPPFCECARRAASARGSNRLL